MFLKESIMKGVMHIGSKHKLDPRYVGPSEILGKVMLTAFRLALPSELIKDS